MPPSPVAAASAPEPLSRRGDPPPRRLDAKAAPPPRARRSPRAGGETRRRDVSTPRDAPLDAPAARTAVGSRRHAATCRDAARAAGQPEVAAAVLVGRGQRAEGEVVGK